MRARGYSDLEGIALQPTQPSRAARRAAWRPDEDVRRWEEGRTPAGSALGRAPGRRRTLALPVVRLSRTTPIASRRRRRRRLRPPARAPPPSDVAKPPPPPPQVGGPQVASMNSTRKAALLRGLNDRVSRAQQYASVYKKVMQAVRANSC